MKFVALSFSLLAASALAQANPNDDGVHINCDISTAYSVGTNRGAFVFTNDKGEVPGQIGIGGGRLFVDAREAELSAADRQRIAQLEREMRLLVPEVQKVTVEAVDIAFTALTEVARALASDPKSTVADLESAHARLRREMGNRPLQVLDEDAVAAIVKPIIAEYVPQIIGGAVSSAVKAVFSGEDNARQFEQRIQRMEKELDRKVEARADALEPLADALCARLRRMDALDNALEYRASNGAPLNLLRVDRSERK